jgi:hypothetical protein
VALILPGSKNETISLAATRPHVDAGFRSVSAQGARWRKNSGVITLYPPSLFQNVVEIEAFPRPKPLEAYACIGGQFGVAFRVSVPHHVRVGGARDEGIRDSGEPGQHRPQCAEGTGPHAAAGRNVEGATAVAFERGEAERVAIGPSVMATRRTSSLAWPNRNSVLCPPASEPL